MTSVDALFTNVPLSRTVNISLDRIFNENQINTTLKKNKYWEVAEAGHLEEKNKLQEKADQR